MATLAKKTRMCAMCAGIFGIIRSIKSIRALIGSRETWKISFVRVDKEGSVLYYMGRVSFRVSYRAFQGLS